MEVSGSIVGRRACASVVEEGTCNAYRLFGAALVIVAEERKRLCTLEFRSRIGG
jgi:hypothetical protein